MISPRSERRFPELSTILLYLAVGFLGFCLNMLVLTGALELKIPVRTSLMLGIAASTLFNFSLDRHVVFPAAQKKALTPQFFKFIGVCLLGAVLNYVCAIWLLALFPTLLPQIAEWGGIIVGTSVNYVLLRFWVF